MTPTDVAAPQPEYSQQQLPPNIRKAYAPQLKLTKNEMSRLASRVQQDFWNAITDHDMRMRRFQRYYLRWRNRTEQSPIGEEDISNFRVPLTQWQVYSKWAKEHAALFGADAEVTCRPVGPDDQRRVRKVARFMNWREFNSLRVQNPGAIFTFRKILFGRSHAYAPWIRETFMAPLEDGTDAEMVHYDGPGFEPLWPDDFICPAEDVRSLHDFSFVIRKYRATPEDLLTGEEQERYQGVLENWELISSHASDRRQRDFYSEQVKREKDIAEGVLYEGGLSSAHTLIVYEWYGKWHRLKGKQDAREDNWDRRERHVSEFVVRYLPDLNMVVGVQDLAEMYPQVKQRRPFVESALVQDGSYWCPSFGELLETMEQELTNCSRLGTEAMQFGVGPIIFYKPASGFDPKTFACQPGAAVPTDDPSSIKVVDLKGDVPSTIVKGQEYEKYSERVTGQTDMNMGRTADRPNQPRTARQTMALIEEGDVRASLDTSVFREDWGTILRHHWMLEKQYGSPRTFFRVTEQEAGGFFPVNRGGAYLTEEDRGGVYDFDVKLATNAWSRETMKQNQLALYQLDLQNPLVVNNPRALWMTLDKVHKYFGDDNFADVIPEPADIGLPVQPLTEWTRLLEGEDIFVNPMDNDQLHIMDHNRRLEDSASDPDHNPRAYNEMVLHVQEHIRQMQQKKLMSAMVAELTQSLASGMGGLSSGAPVGLQDIHQQLGTMVGDPQAMKKQEQQNKPQKQ